MSQNHFTLSFPLKSPADAKVLAEQLPPLMPQLFQAADTIGTIHSSGLAQQRYAKSHRIFANSRGVKDFRRFRNSQDGTWFSRSVLGA
jgi:hypothetical protein